MRNVALLAAEGLRDLYSRRRALGAILLAALLITCVAGDLRWFSRPREDWQLAASSLKTVSQGPCVLFAPSDSVDIYAFFEPDLRSRDCTQQGSPALHSSGKKLVDVADIVIDNCTPAGDALSGFAEELKKRFADRVMQVPMDVTDADSVARAFGTPTRVASLRQLKLWK